MANTRSKPSMEKMRSDVESGKKRYVRYKEGAELYSMGQHGFMDLAKEAKAVRKINGVCLVNVQVLDQYIEDLYS